MLNSDDFTITDNQFIEDFSENNFAIRTAIIERLVKGWQGAKIGTQFGILIGVVEQYVSLLEDIVMLLYALKKKKNEMNKSLFSIYSKIHISEKSNGSCTTEKLINILNGCNSNDDYENVFGFNLNKMNLRANDDEFKNLFIELIKDLKNRTIDLPLVKVNNAIKHGFRVKLDETSDVPKAIFFINTIDSGQNMSKVEIRTFPVIKEVIDILFKRAKILSREFQAIFIFIQQ